MTSWALLSGRKSIGQELRSLDCFQESRRVLLWCRHFGFGGALALTPRLWLFAKTYARAEALKRSATIQRVRSDDNDGAGDDAADVQTGSPAEPSTFDKSMFRCPKREWNLSLLLPSSKILQHEGCSWSMHIVIGACSLSMYCRGFHIV